MHWLSHVSPEKQQNGSEAQIAATASLQSGGIVEPPTSQGSWHSSSQNEEQ
jgi:hypothetical protein